MNHDQSTGVVSKLENLLPASAEESSLTSSLRPPRWKFIAAAIFYGFALFVGVSFLQWAQQKQTQLYFIGLDGICNYLMIGGGVLFVLFLATVYFKPRRLTIFVAGALCFTAAYWFSRNVRIDGYNGDRTPRLTWIWTPPAEQNIKTYFTSRINREMPRVSDEVFQTTDNDFPGLLGQDRIGKVDRISLATNWKEHSPKIFWQHPVGIGWSSFAVVGHAAVNLEQRDDFECVVCYDIRSGTELWCHSEKTRFDHEHGDGPRTTPTIHDGRVVSMGAKGLVTCIDLKDGSLLWKRESFEDPLSQNLIFGMSGSPLVVDNKVIVTPGANNGLGHGCTAICYALDSGAELWRCGSDQTSYSSPSVAMVCGQQQILSFNGAGLRAMSLEGHELWLQPWVTQGDARVNVAQPISLTTSEIDEPIGSDNEQSQWAKIAISSGYDRGTGLLKITRTGDQWKSEVVWESKQLKSKFSNFVVYHNYAYGLDNGILTCIDMKAGDRAWKKGRYGHGKILLVQDKLLILSETGEVVVVTCNPEAHQELAKFEALAGKTWNNLALSGNRLIIRNYSEAMAIELPTN